MHLSNILLVYLSFEIFKNFWSVRSYLHIWVVHWCNNLILTFHRMISKFQGDDVRFLLAKNTFDICRRCGRRAPPSLKAHRQLTNHLHWSHLSQRWHLMFSPILMRGSWWTYTYPFWGFVLKFYVQAQFHCMILQANHSQKWWCNCIISCVPFCYLSLTSSLLKRWHDKTSHTFPPHFCSQNDNQFLKDFLESQGRCCLLFPRRIGTHVLQPRVDGKVRKQAR